MCIKHKAPPLEQDNVLGGGYMVISGSKGPQEATQEPASCGRDPQSTVQQLSCRQERETDEGESLNMHTLVFVRKIHTHLPQFEMEIPLLLPLS